MSEFRRCVVREVRRLAPDLVKVSLDPGPEERERWLRVPGGFVTFHLPTSPRIQRCYSLVSSPEDALPRIVVREKPGGLGSVFFNRTLAVGMELDVKPPQTRLWEPEMDREPGHWMLFGAGIGVTPLLGLARHALSSNKSNRISLVLGNRSLDRIAMLESVEALALNPAVWVRHVFSDGSGDSPLFNGRMTAKKTTRLIETARERQGDNLQTWGFVSGPPEMRTEVRKGWAAAGLPLEHLRTERFDFPPGSNQATTKPVIVEMVNGNSGKHWSFGVEATDENILEAAIRANVPLDSQCRGGVCGRCKVEMLEGEVRTDKPIGGGEILCCSSRPASSRLKLRFR